MKKALFFFFLLFVSIQQLLVLPGCANIIPPTGGARDSLPPVLVKVTPHDSTRQFEEKHINFIFNEFVDVQNAMQELLVSPIMKTTPIVEYKLNTVSVKIKDTLEPNTTYSFDFGRAIKDVNEGNVLKNFVYTFTTGSYFDSLQLSGKVINAETGKPDSTLVVILHTKGNDSALVTDKPRYVTKLDGKGNFVFKNLPPKTYYVYALKDESGTYKYFGTKLFAFADSAVTISATVKPVVLYAWEPVKKQTESNAVASNASMPNIGGNNIRGNNNQTRTNRLRFSSNLNNKQQDLLGSFELTFEQRLKSFDSTKIGLFTDTAFVPVTKYRFIQDSTQKKLQLQIEWKQGTEYHLILDKEFAEDSSGRKLLKTDTLSFTTKRITDYGQLKISFKKVDLTKNPVLLFYSGTNLVKSIPMQGNQVSSPMFLPGEYEIRLLYDSNKNGKWDTGEFFGKRRQPEMILPIERKINVRPGTENEFDIAL